MKFLRRNGGAIFNLLLAVGYGLFCWHYFRTVYEIEHPGASPILAVLVFALIFFLARIVVSFIHQLGHVAAAWINGFRVIYFEASFIRIWQDRDAAGRSIRRFKLFFEPTLIFSGSVHVSLADKFETAAQFNANADPYRRFIIGGFIFNLAIMAAVVLWYVVALILHFSSEPISVALWVAAWFMISESMEERGKRGDYAAFKQFGNPENLLMTLASQSVTQDIDHSVLLTQAEVILKKKDIDELCADYNFLRFSVGFLANSAMYAAAERYYISDALIQYIDNLYDDDTLLKRPADLIYLLARRIPTLVSLFLTRGDKERADRYFALYKRLAGSERQEGDPLTLLQRDTAAHIFISDYDYFLDCESSNKWEDDLRTQHLEAMRFIEADAFAWQFAYYRDTLTAAEANTIKALCESNE